MSNRAAYIEKMKMQLDQLNATMDQLEEKTQEITEDVRFKYKVHLRQLRQQSYMAGDKLDDLKIAAEESWDELVAGLEKERDAFVQLFSYFKTES